MTDVATAELAKYAANAYLATQISFINEMADIAAAAGADINDVSRIIKMDRRVGDRAYLNAGIGFGGSCLPKDLRDADAQRRGARRRSVRRTRGERRERTARGPRGRAAAVGDGRRRREEDRRLGPGLQGRHQRRARVAGDQRRAAAAVARRDGAGVRPAGRAECRSTGRRSHPVRRAVRAAATTPTR